MPYLSREQFNEAFTEFHFQMMSLITNMDIYFRVGIQSEIIQAIALVVIIVP
jgi:hypothetical protein